VPRECSFSSLVGWRLFLFGSLFCLGGKTMSYDHQNIERKWQTHWKENKTFKTNTYSEKEKVYALDMFPYPSGSGLHVGHPVGYTATDIFSRMKRMQGYEVLHPMGWDAFGLPA